MVHMMDSLHSHKVEDFTEEEYASVSKRSRLASGSLNQWGSMNHEHPLLLSQYNPLDEPSPLGLKLRKTPSLLDLIQMKLNQSSNASVSAATDGTIDSGIKKNAKRIASSSANDKLKASNFPASVLKIGSWEYVSRYDGDLVAKCYFAKHKLVWEVLDGGLKSKIEIQWSDIEALKAEFPDDGPGTLTIVLARQPVFFRETNPQPRKHTLWQATTDFTDGQASMYRQHYIECLPGVLNKHYEKLIQCDMRLGMLSQQPEKVTGTPIFEQEASSLENPDESKGDGCNQMLVGAKESPAPAFKDSASAAALQLSSFDLGLHPMAAQHVYEEALLPSSVMDRRAIEGSKLLERHSDGQNSRERLEMPGLRSSMSMSDFVNHFGNCISEQITSGNLPSDRASECRDMLENISQVLLSDTQSAATGLDEKSLMKKVNSLCCLLQDPAVASSGQISGGNHSESVDQEKHVSFELMNNSTENMANDIAPASEADLKDGPGGKQAPTMKRKDSYVDLLLHLPRIASLPKILSGIVEDDEERALF